MRYDKDHKARTRERILEVAADAFRGHGIAATGIARLMGEAGLTTGGFYAHFASKDDLVAESITRAFDQTRATLVRSADDDLERVVRRYLHPLHVQHPDKGCPAASLGGEALHQGPVVRAALQQGLAALEAEIARRLPVTLDDDVRAHRATMIFALMIGCLQRARAADTAAATRILQDGVDAALRIANAAN